jgi:hypothetical protein
MKSMIHRFVDKIEKSDSGCWIWGAGKDGHGYGQFWLDGREQAAHRVSYELFVGPIPEGLVIDHLCRTPACVNPSHIEPVTVLENNIRGLAPASAMNGETCRNGKHPWPESAVRAGKQLRCQPCSQAAYRRRVEKSKAAAR